MAFARILVAVDGSETSNKALVAGLQLARESGGCARLVHVIDEVSLASGLEDPSHVLHVARKFGRQVLDDGAAIAQAAGIEADTRLIETAARRLGEAVADEAVAWRADLVCTGTHGRRGIGRVLLGSGAESIIRSSPVPALVIRGGEGA